MAYKQINSKNYEVYAPIEYFLAEFLPALIFFEGT
jgi:hypothetical protein